jgi:hypothetical protein
MMMLAFLGADIFYIFTGKSNPHQSMLLDNEATLLANYRAANAQGKAFIEQACAAAGKL